LADALPHYIRDVPLTDGASLKIGFLGLAEEEWLGQITTVPEELIEYEDYVHCANRTCKYLREEEGCQFIIALTHMRIPNDQNLVKNIAPGLIDLVLGGHDHVWHHEKILETLYVKSGTNFRNLSLIRIEFHKMSVVPWVAQVEDLFKQLIASTDVYNCIEEGPSISSIGVLKHAFEFTFKRFQATLVPINVTHQIPANQTMELYVAEKVAKYNSESLRTIGFSDVDLDTTFKEIRVKETSIANFFADLIKSEFKCDIGVINTGTIRADEYYSPGPLTYQTI
jgi:5'-nucleotidase